VVHINYGISSFVKERAKQVSDLARIEKSQYDEYGVRRGLRNPDGTGVVAGITRLGNVRGYYIQDSERMPDEGKLTYRGIDLNDLTSAFLAENRPGYEETAYLLLFGELPTKQALAEFTALLAEYRELPSGFTEDMILAAPSRNIMNKLSRSILALYSYDAEPETFGGDVADELEKALRLVAQAPIIIANAYAAKRHYFDKESLHVRLAKPELAMAENFLRMLHGNDYTPEDVRLLDLCLVVQAEHGGGNNSAFACRVLSSSGTDIYSAISAAVGSLKGFQHGGANAKVEEMFNFIKQDVPNYNDDGAVRDYLVKIMKKQGGCGDGLIYGMGHAIYTKSDPRALLLKSTAKALAEAKGKAEMIEEFELIDRVERLTAGVYEEIKGHKKTLCANVDMYIGSVYKLLGIPRDLYTPLFAVARIAGWCAHRIEELWGNGRIIRPAFRAIAPRTEYIALDERE